MKTPLLKLVITGISKLPASKMPVMIDEINVSKRKNLNVPRNLAVFPPRNFISSSRQCFTTKTSTHYPWQSNVQYRGALCKIWEEITRSWFRIFQCHNHFKTLPGLHWGVCQLLLYCSYMVSFIEQLWRTKKLELWLWALHSVLFFHLWTKQSCEHREALNTHSPRINLPLSERFQDNRVSCPEMPVMFAGQRKAYALTSRLKSPLPGGILKARRNSEGRNQTHYRTQHRHGIRRWSLNHQLLD